MNSISEFIHAVKTAVCLGIDARNMIAVVGELLPWGEMGSFTDDLIALDYQTRAVAMHDDPFAPEQCDGAIGPIFDRDEVDERVWLVRG